MARRPPLEPSTPSRGEEDGQESPQARSPVPMPGVAAFDEDEGVFLLDDEDEEEEEAPTGRSRGCFPASQ